MLFTWIDRTSMLSHATLVGLIFTISSNVLASDGSQIRLLPAETSLVGSESTQRFIVEAVVDGRYVGELSGATFESSNPAVAAVDSGGVVRPTGDGEGTITVTVDDRHATANVVVTKFTEPFTWSFGHH